MNYDKQSSIKAKQSLVAQSVLNDSVLKKKLSFTKIEFRGFQFISTKDNLHRNSS